jgi:DNA modification methylase
MATWQVIHGDCLEVLRTLPAGSVDAVVTDPPYGINYSSGHGSTVWGDGSIEGDGDTSSRDKALAILDGVPALVFGTWKRPAPDGTRACLVWDTLGALGMGDLRIPWKPAHQQIYVLGDPAGFIGNRTTDVIQCPPVQSMAQNGRLHPFEKPVPLLIRLLQKVRPGTVVDPFCGVGSTGVACMATGHDFIGIEIDAGYCEIARRRIAEAANHLYAEASA